MRVAMGLILFVPFLALGQVDTMLVSLSLTHEEIAYVHTALGATSSKLMVEKNKLAAQVDHLNGLISSAASTQTDSAEVHLTITVSAVQYIVNVLAQAPWLEVYLTMPKLLAVLPKRE